MPGFHSLEVLHRGSASTVYRGMPDGGDQPVALKVMRDADGATEVARLRELSGLPGVVPVVGDGHTTSGRPFVAMACADGGDYGAALRRRSPLPVDEVVGVGLAVAEALGAVHALGLLHHGVEPGNLLLSDEGAVLADAGAVLPVDAVPPAAGLDVHAVRYAPPEALRGEPHSAASDVYRLAVTLWTLLAGHAPFDDPASNDPFGYRERVLGEAPPRIAREDVPAALEAVLGRALAKEPSERFASAAGFAEALAEAVAPGAPDVGLDVPEEAASRSPAGEDGAVGGPEPEVPPEPDADAGAEGAVDTTVGLEEPAWWDTIQESSEPAGDDAPAVEAAPVPPVGDAGTADEPGADGAVSVTEAPEEPAWWESDQGSSERAGDDDRAVGEAAPSSLAGEPGTADEPGVRAWWDTGAGSREAGGGDDPDTVSVVNRGEDGSSDGHPTTGVREGGHAPRPSPPPDRAPEPAPSDDPWAGLDVWSGPPPRREPPPPPSPGFRNPAEAGPPAPPAGWTPPETRVRATPMPSRRWPLYAAVAGAVLVLAAVAVGVVVVVRSGADPGPSAADPSASPSDDASDAPRANVVAEAAPTGVELEDSGATVVLTWEDNTGGEAAHHVVGGPLGSVPASLAAVVPGETEAAVDGLDADGDYCFTVIAVVSVDEVAYADEVCTARG
ncbi:protein kinase [Nocardiopsis sp. NPDC050513]|uniref:protein kinase domain-containing protein n=1 Tax=Nocardiopsis sp. NPDC050513 TaxID=3364338 RepID=UPI0037BBDDD4